MQVRRITIVDVAKDADVSPATVSRVLNNNSHVDVALRERVLRSIKKLGYLPNANAQSLITHNTYEIGFLVSDISNSYYGAIARTVENIVSPQQYNLILCSTDEGQLREATYLQMMVRRHVDGLILNPTCLNNDAICDLSHSIPILLMNRKIDDPNFHGDLVDTDGYAGCKLLTEALLHAGHRKIYCVRGPEIYPNARNRFRGFVDAMREHGIEVGPRYPYVFDGHFTAEGGVQAVDHLFSFSDPPTAILSESNMSTVGIMQRLLEYHVDVPEDISLAGHDQIENMQLFAARPCSVVYDLQAIAKCVGTAILERIQNPALDMRQYTFSPTLQHGNSIAPPSSTLSRRLSDVKMMGIRQF